jgi:hypothetical protein
VEIKAIEQAFDYHLINARFLSGLTRRFYREWHLSQQEVVMALPESVIIQLATLSEEDRLTIQKCRGQHNRLGFAYQLMFVKVFNRFPNQTPLEIQPQILTFAVLQLGVKTELITAYQKRQCSQMHQCIKNYSNFITIAYTT